MDRTFRRPWLASVSSPLVFDVSTLFGLCDGPCLSLSSTSFSSANRKVQYRPNMTLLNPNKAEDTNYSSRETATERSPPRKRSDTRTPSDDQWHESQWQRDRSRTDLQRRNIVRTWSQLGTLLVNSSFEHKIYHHQMPALITPCSNLDCGQPRGHQPGTPSQWYQAPGNNNVTPPQMPISLYASRNIFVSGYSRNLLGIT